MRIHPIVHSNILAFKTTADGLNSKTCDARPRRARRVTSPLKLAMVHYPVNQKATAKQTPRNLRSARRTMNMPADDEGPDKSRDESSIPLANLPQKLT